MPIIEDDVKNAVANFLEGEGYVGVDKKLGTRRGYDVEGVHPSTKRRLVIECKGEAQNGSQHKRSWENVAGAMLTSLREMENSELDHDVGMAFPDTPEYQGRLEVLEDFCRRSKLFVFWVCSNGKVRTW
ncbi:hypothetical protein [Microbulbifer taiwanensis]|uniref:Restriction endonuclease type IV Mrr domain-containing protein n=1 Tax=Microbulbifer taiwanensis TaxID=986746 RepID=A0ABW1YPE0_9GAMM|nr:hypothetical protein [Microbulbifer taiwanensis]